MTRRWTSFAFIATALALAGSLVGGPSLAAAAPAVKAAAKPTPKPTIGPPYGNLMWRPVGPAAVGGRVTSVAGTAQDSKLYYAGAAGGGVWKSSNGGQTWIPVFNKQKVAAIGAVAIDPTNKNVVWVGTGESNPRNDVSYGDGVYKSTNGGKTWARVGLKNSRYVSRIVIDPKDPNHVLVAAFGDFFRNNTHGGVYVTWDGGKTWAKTLYLGPKTGGSDLAMDESNPNVVYAGMWEFRRKPWTFQSGGKADGLFKSTDGGKTWTRLVGNGLPTGITGRIGLAVSRSNPNYVYALIEAKHGILWRSEDAGAHWTMVSDNTLVDQRPFYFTHVAVDPSNPRKVYGASEFLSMSTDGGRHFKIIAPQVHVDYHAIWIAPNDPSRIIVGEDGGYALTVDGMKNWFFSKNLPIAQVYHVAVSNENPYQICIGVQDNNAWCGPSNSLDPSGIMNKYWIVTTGGDGEWAVPDPANPNYIWSDSEVGSLTVYNKVTQDQWFVQPYLQTDLQQFDLATSKYRFNWDSPIAFAPWNPHIAWLGGNVIFQTKDRGMHWKVISPDLTLNLKSHQGPSGGPITYDVSGAEYSDTILDIEGSRLHKGEIWVGTDDGLVQLTLDGGKHWKNVTPPGVPPFGRVETVAPSTLRDGTAYVSIDRHRSGDYKPYLFVTHDFGKTWTKIVNGLPKHQYVRTVRPDIHNPNLVYAGTEEGMWISYDGGAVWKSFQNNLPTASVRDIRIQRAFDDLVIATHGHSVFVLDDIRALQKLPKAVAAGAWLFKPRTSYEYNLHENDEGIYTQYTAPNPPYGVMITFYQKTPGKTAPAVQILNAQGQVVRMVSGTHTVHHKKVSYVTNKVGLNRYTWNFTVNGPQKWYGAARKRYQGPNEGPTVPPGRYAVRMTIDGKTFVRPFVVKADPRTKVTLGQMNFTYAYALKVFGQFGVVDTMLNNLDSLKTQLAAANAAAKKAGNAGLQTKIAAALAQHNTLFNLLTANFHNDESSIERPGKLRNNMEMLLYSAQGVVTPAIVSYGKRIDVRYRAAIARYNRYAAKGLLSVNAALAAAKLKTVSLPAVRP
ncbi:MAG: WD40/YVTN/BNR-like repeat-containing protein [Vulcanimicrobiaceae bacterium]